MKWLPRIIVFFLSFTVDVRIHASEEVLNFEVDENPVEIPNQCLEKTGMCAVRTGSAKKFKVETDHSIISLSEESSFVRLSEEAGKVIEGSVLIETDQAYTIVNSFGKIKVVHGKSWFEFRKGSVLVKNLTGEVVIQNLNSKQDYNLDSGYEVTVGPLMPSGVVLMEVARPLQISATLKSVAQVFFGSRAEFLTQMKTLLPKWKISVENASEDYRTIADRMIASAEEKEKLVAKRRQEALKEQHRIRNLFFKNTFGIDP